MGTARKRLPAVDVHHQTSLADIIYNNPSFTMDVNNRMGTAPSPPPRARVLLYWVNVGGLHNSRVLSRCSADLAAMLVDHVWCWQRGGLSHKQKWNVGRMFKVCALCPPALPPKMPAERATACFSRCRFRVGGDNF